MSNVALFELVGRGPDMSHVDADPEVLRLRGRASRLRLEAEVDGGGCFHDADRRCLNAVRAAETDLTRAVEALRNSLRDEWEPSADDVAVAERALGLSSGALEGVEVLPDLSEAGNDDYHVVVRLSDGSFGVVEESGMPPRARWHPVTEDGLVVDVC